MSATLAASQHEPKHVPSRPLQTTTPPQVSPVRSEIGSDMPLFLQKRAASARPSLPKGLQASLRIGNPDDEYEREAERLAERVMRMVEPRLQRCSCGGACAECRTQQPDTEAGFLQTKQARGSGGAGVAPPAVHHALRAGGQPLARGARQFFGSRFGDDFGDIRVHADASAATAAESVQALAFTVGKHIVFGAGQYQPDTQSGKRLLAHELTHTIQQGAAGRGRARRGFAEGRGVASQPSAHAHISVQRQEDLRASRFSGNRVLERVFDGSALVSQRHNRTGAHVRLIQESLVAQGYALPAHGADGVFGPETEAAVRAFQIDAGAAILDGIVGAETMRLLDMHDPGGTTGAGGAPPAAATAAFSEAPTEPFAGYDDSTAPNWLVVPVNGRRRAAVAITPADARPTYVSDAPGVASVDATESGVVVTGLAGGTANIRAMAGAAVLARLQVSVKDRRDLTVAFHYVCDSAPAAAGGPHCSNGAPSADEMRSLLNRVWERQANVRFTGGAAHNIVVPGDVGASVEGFTAAPEPEIDAITALSAGADYNVFRVWHHTVDGTNPNGGSNLGNNTILADVSCADGLGLPHEAGHFLGLGHGSGFIMTPCGGRADRRVSKAMADIANP